MTLLNCSKIESYNVEKPRFYVSFHIREGDRRRHIAGRNCSCDIFFDVLEFDSEIGAVLNQCMSISVSFMDGGNTTAANESFYHGMLIGMLQSTHEWQVRSNREAGNGRADIILVDEKVSNGIHIEVKNAKNSEELSARAEEGLKQNISLAYDAYFCGMGEMEIRRYGITFCGKRCAVAQG